MIFVKENSTAKQDKPVEAKSAKQAEAKAPKKADEKAQKEAAPTEKKADAPAKAEATPKKEEKKAEEKKRELLFERVFNVPLAKAYNTPKQWRPNTAIRLLREFCARHAKADAKSVRIATPVNEFVRRFGQGSVPKHVKIKLSKDKAGLAVAELAE